MPYVLTVMDDGHLVHVVAAGRCTVADEAALSESLRLNSQFLDDFTMLVDLTGGTLAEHDSGNVTTQPDLMTFPLPQRLAFVSPDWSHWKDSALWSKLSGRLGRNSIAFFDLNIACTWLGITDLVRMKVAERPQQ